MIWVEHDMQMVADLADRICVLNYGGRLAEGPPDAVLRDPRVVEAYLEGGALTSIPALSAALALSSALGERLRHQ